MNERMDQLAEGVLVEMARNGRSDAFMELARRLEDRVRAVIYGMTRNAQDSDDLTQETFLYAYRSVKGFKGNSSFYTWVYRIAVNLTLNFLKKKGREKGRESYEDGLAHLESEGSLARSPERDSMRKELRTKLDEAVAGLGGPYRAAFSLVALQGMSHGQAAEVLGCSENTVSWRMHKARKMLQAKLRPFLEEAGDAL